MWLCCCNNKFHHNKRADSYDHIKLFAALEQSAENIGMCLAMLPVVGITLPFFSYGGSSMVASYMMIGLVQSIKSHNQKYFFEREKS